MHKHHLGFDAAIIGAFALLSAILTYPMILHLTTHMAYHKYLEPSAGDHWVFMWAFGFVERMVVESKQWPFFTNMIFYPHGVDLTYPLLFGMGLPLVVSIPFVHVLGVVPTYNLFILGAFLATAYTTFLLVRYITHDSRAAFISGIIFAFCPYQMMRAVGHFNLATSGMWIPLYVLLFMKAMKYGSIKYLVLTPLVLALTFASNPYYAIFLGIFTVIYVIYHVIPWKNQALNRALLRRLCFMGGFVVFLFLPVVWVLLTHGEQESKIYVPLEESSRWGADLLAFFVPSTHHTLLGNSVRSIYARFYTPFTGNDTEQTVYIGYVVLALAVIGIIKAPKAETRFWFVAALVFLGLSLGPFLRINGNDTVTLSSLKLSLPLPNILLHIIPGLNIIRGWNRFSIMLMLAMAVLAAYGTRQLLQRFEGRVVVALFCLGVFVAAIAGEFLTAPLRLVDARIPRIYEQIADEGEKGGTLLDVPLRWSLFNYEYYQVVHQKRLLLGQVPRLSISFLTGYADSVPFMPLFKDPDLIKDYDQVPIDKRDVFRFIEFFDLSWIVLHKDYIWPETFDRLMRFIMANFPIAHVEEEGDIVALQMARDTYNVMDLAEPEGYIVDFGGPPQFFVADDWSLPERWEDLTVSWAVGKESQLWLFFPQATDFAMELRLLPARAPGFPPQTVKVYVNEQWLGEVELDNQGWHSYTLHLPRTHLAAGMNRFRFVYRHTAVPLELFPGDDDFRELAVAFDFIAFRPE